MMLNRRALLKRLLTPLAVMALFATGLFGSGFVRGASASPAAAQSPGISTAYRVASPDGGPLLLVHGIADTCDSAFNRTSEVPNTGLNAKPGAIARQDQNIFSGVLTISWFSPKL